MPVNIRILDAANKHMQRLGFLKLLAHHAQRTETSNLAALANPLVDAAIKRVRMEPPYSAHVKDYVQHRLTGSVYTELRNSVLGKNPTQAALEMQDLYLSDPRMPSTTGKLNDASREKYPYLGTALGLIKPGTWSSMTRAMTLLALVPPEELSAFEKYSEQHNPLLLSREQAALMLYCLIDNDAEILFPLYDQLLKIGGSSFDGRIAGDLLPDIIRSVVNALSKTSLPVEDRDRLAHLEKVAGTIASYRDRNYSGTTAREVSIRVRLEPFCDVGLLTKTDRHRFVYQFTPALKKLMADWGSLENTDNFLQNHFFTTLSNSYNLVVTQASEEDAHSALQQAGIELSSAIGYSPIKDCALLAGIRLLFTQLKVLELGRSHQILLAWQKEAPSFVRFTVDRMGGLAYVKFLKTMAPLIHDKQ